MIYQSSSRDVSCRIEIVGGDFEGEVGEARRKMFQSLCQVLVAVGIAKKEQLGVLATEHTLALIRALERIKKSGEEESQEDDEEE